MMHVFLACIMQAGKAARSLHVLDGSTSQAMPGASCMVGYVSATQLVVVMAFLAPLCSRKLLRADAGMMCRARLSKQQLGLDSIVSV